MEHLSSENRVTHEAQIYLRNVGEMLQEQRNNRGLNVRELAEISGVSSGMISQIERGLANPSINTLSRLAAALGLQLGFFFEQKPAIPTDIIVRRHERRRLNIADPDFLFELLTPDLEHSLEFVWVESAPGSSTQKIPFQHQGEECGLLIQGRLEVHIADQTFFLEAGDSIIFDSSLQHWYHNPGPERVLSVWAITPPSF